MRPKLQFVGTGIVINGNASVFVGSGPYQADILANVDTGEIRGSNDEINVEKKTAGFIITLPDVKIVILLCPVARKEIKEYACDVLVLEKKDVKLLSAIKPRLAILRGNLYDSRELAKKTGVQVIAAQPVIDLFSYNALGNQNYLLK